MDLTSSGVDLHSGDLMNVHMTYDGTTLVTQITDATTNATFTTSSSVNIPNTVGGNTAYVGFTGASGGLAAVQDIVNWTYASSGTSSSQPAGSPLQITTSALPGGAVGVSYNAALTANGVPPYTWGLLGGQLPPGLSLQPSNGQIAGTPTQAGAFSFQAQVKDSTGASASSSFSINTGTSSAPVVSRVSPNAGPTSGGTSVTLSGSNFQAGATVLFGGVAASAVTVSSATQIQALTPAHLAGTVDVTVRNPDGQSSTLSGSFAYNAVWPTVTSVSPNSGSTAGGTAVTITGTNFLAGALVLFGSVSSPSVTVHSATQIQAVTPANPAEGVDVTVQDPDGQSGKLAGGFTYTTPPPAGKPMIGDVSPSSGTAGTQVTIDGANFASGATVKFGSTQAASTIFASSTQLKASVPALGTGTYDVTVTNPDPNSATLPGAFTVTAAQSLLAGMTPANFTVPSGWTLVKTQDFESGAVGGGDAIVGSIAGNNPHSGSKSLAGTYAGDGSEVAYYVDPNATGSFSELYLSFYDFMEAQGSTNDELFIARFFIHDGSGNLAQEVIIDNLGAGSSSSNTGFNSTSSSLVIEPQSPSSGTTTAIWGPGYQLGWGTWTQWEIEFKPNSPGNSDGLIRVYKNGALFLSKVNIQLNGSLNMNNAAGVEVGGVYTKLTWIRSDGSCGSFIGDGTDSGPRVSNFNHLPCPNQGPPSGVVPIFKRTIDDVIVIKK